MRALEENEEIDVFSDDFFFLLRNEADLSCIVTLGKALIKEKNTKLVEVFSSFTLKLLEENNHDEQAEAGDLYLKMVLLLLGCFDALTEDMVRKMKKNNNPAKELEYVILKIASVIETNVVFRDNDERSNYYVKWVRSVLDLLDLFEAKFLPNPAAFATVLETLLHCIALHVFHLEQARSLGVRTLALCNKTLPRSGTSATTALDFDVATTLHASSESMHANALYIFRNEAKGGKYPPSVIVKHSTFFLTSNPSSPDSQVRGLELFLSAMGGAPIDFAESIAVESDLNAMAQLFVRFLCLAFQLQSYPVRNQIKECFIGDKGKKQPNRDAGLKLLIGIFNQLPEEAAPLQAFVCDLMKSLATSCSPSISLDLFELGNKVLSAMQFDDVFNSALLLLRVVVGERGSALKEKNGKLLVDLRTFHRVLSLQMKQHDDEEDDGEPLEVKRKIISVKERVKFSLESLIVLLEE